MCEAIIMMVHRLMLKVIDEGVGAERQSAFKRSCVRMHKAFFPSILSWRRSFLLIWSVGDAYDKMPNSIDQGSII
jgi:hypothetical protein